MGIPFDLEAYRKQKMLKYHCDEVRLEFGATLVVRKPLPAATMMEGLFPSAALQALNDTERLGEKKPRGCPQDKWDQMKKEEAEALAARQKGAVVDITEKLYSVVCNAVIGMRDSDGTFIELKVTRHPEEGAIHVEELTDSDIGTIYQHAIGLGGSTEENGGVTAHALVPFLEIARRMASNPDS